MIRTIITPTQSNFNIALNIPDEYLGEELELLIFKKQEGFEQKKSKPKMKLSEKYKGIFTKEDAKSFSEHTQKMRN